jgi:hypothetical protein
MDVDGTATFKPGLPNRGNPTKVNPMVTITARLTRCCSGDCGSGLQDRPNATRIGGPTSASGRRAAALDPD